MLQVRGVVQDHSAVRAVNVGGADQVELGIDPVDLLLDEVEGDAVGPVDALAHDRVPVGAVHARALDLGLLAPVRPKQPPYLI